MTPVLPGFAGFVPRAISRIAPNASFVNGSNWEAFPVALTNTTFLEPSDPLFYSLQKKIVQKQQVAYGNVSHIYTIDSYNENVRKPRFDACECAAYMRLVTTKRGSSLPRQRLKQHRRQSQSRKSPALNFMTSP